MLPDTQQHESTGQVIVAGIPGSGSTYVWQVVKDMHDGQTQKTHDYIDVPDECPVLVTTRDPAASIVSACRRHFHYDRGPTTDEVRSILPMFVYWQAVALRYAARPRTIVLRYEDVWSNTFAILDALLRLGIVADSSETRERFKASLQRRSLEANRAIASKVVGGYDAVSMLHANHIHDGTPDGWRSVVTPDVETFLNSMRA